MERGKALFLDRDGTIIHDVHYIADPARIQFLPGVRGALQLFQQAGYQLVIVSNQSGIGRGIITEQQAEAVNGKMLDELLAADVQVAASYWCPHTPEDHCICRKPLPGMLLQAAEELGVDLSASFMVGDKMSDVEAGSAAGCRTVLVNRKYGDPDPVSGAIPDFVCADWDAVFRALLYL